MGTAQQDTERRLIGVVVPVGALRGADSMGIGEFPDLIAFGHLCKKMCVGLIQILPVNDTGYESSPYSALTAFALHPIYLRIADLPEAQDPQWQKQLTAMKLRFEHKARFNHYEVMKAKLSLLREIFATNEAAIRASAQGCGDLAAWIAANGWVKEYAVYRRLKQVNQEQSWRQWDAKRTVTRAELVALWDDVDLKAEHLFWTWIQKALDEQFSAAAASIKRDGILLEGDLPILINDDSCDAWAHPEYFHLELSAGAPPDMYSPSGQNWGFPIYNWDALEKENYVWWRDRLKVAAKYYAAYRIDHVLGFFRIWATARTEKDNNSLLGRYIPYVAITKKDLVARGFDVSRIRWLSYPHVPTSEVWDSLKRDGCLSENDIQYEAKRAFMLALNRIDSEELWLFKDSIKGERDIDALQLHPAVKNYLLDVWKNRLFLQYENGHYFPTWKYRESRAYCSLSDGERKIIEQLLAEKKDESEEAWEKLGEKLLSVLVESSAMLPCAEDLGEVPDCVPRVLMKLRILGLRVVRWYRWWNKEGQPYIPLEDYPELSVCTPAVHDSSTLREWWEREAEKEALTDFIGQPFLPPVYNPGVAKIILHHLAGAASRFRVFQIQDLLHLSQKWYAPDPATERINVPGTYNSFNWTYRLPATIDELAKDEVFVKGVEELAAIPPLEKKKVAIRGKR
ncbi:MAG: 4-alpha-glucanotransferase [Treponema sp.]|jgi:4-alpha-glucanotransferase|nr:4-alpha-glucanotransferase [Treponema sp.]